MADIGTELLNAVRNRFTRLLGSDKITADLLSKIENGKCTFADAENYATRVGELLAEAIKAEITVEKIPNGELTREITDRILTTMLKQDHELVTDAAAQTMEALNKAAGLRMKAIRPAVEVDRIEGLIEKAVSYDSYEDAAWVMQEPVINFSQHVCDRLIEENVSSHFKAGLKPRLERTATSGCCEWCALLAGKYDYPVSREIYRRHRDCRCLVLYDPGNGKVQDAHTKRVYDSARDAEHAAEVEARKKKLEKWEKDRAKYPAARKEILRRVKSGEYSLQLKHQKFLQHVEGTQQYIKACNDRGKLQSYLVISEKEVQQIISRYTGLGDPDITPSGIITNSEFFSTGKVIGYYHEDGIPIPTDRVQIIHGKSGSHVVPVKPLEVKP